MLAAIIACCAILTSRLSKIQKEMCARQPAAPAQPAAPSKPETRATLPPRNVLTVIYENVERGMTRERLERRVGELNDGHLGPALKCVELITTPNASYATEYWSWTLREYKDGEGWWVTTLVIDLVEDKVAGLHYSVKREVDELNLHK